MPTLLTIDTGAMLMFGRVSLAVGLFAACCFSSVRFADAANYNASWHCHRGFLLVHRGTGYSRSNAPTSWNSTDLTKARESFQECYRLASRESDTFERVMAVLGYGQASLSLAQEANAFSVGVYVHHDPVAKKTFRQFHEYALVYSREALMAAEKIESSELQALEDQLDSDRARGAIQNLREVANDVKNKILATNFDGIPRSAAEFAAFVRADRLPFYSVPQDMGLTIEERCTVKSTPAAVKEFAPVDAGGELAESPRPSAPIQIEVAVNADGTLRAAHVARSSGSVERDADALGKAYQTKFVAATRNCRTVPGVVVLKY